MEMSSGEKLKEFAEQTSSCVATWVRIQCLPHLAHFIHIQNDLNSWTNRIEQDCRSINRIYWNMWTRMRIESLFCAMVHYRWRRVARILVQILLLLSNCLPTIWLSSHTYLRSRQSMRFRNQSSRHRTNVNRFSWTHTCLNPSWSVNAIQTFSRRTVLMFMQSVFVSTHRMWISRIMIWVSWRIFIQ